MGGKRLGEEEEERRRGGRGKKKMEEEIMGNLSLLSFWWPFTLQCTEFRTCTHYRIINLD